MTDHNDKELNEPLKSWKDEHDVSELIERYDIKHPIYLILESDEKESKVSVSAPPRYTKRVRRNLKKMNEVDRLRYLEVFADSIHRYESLKVPPLPSQTDYGERLASFEHEHGRKPSKRERDQLLEDAENAIEMYTDEYEKLRSKVLEWNEKLQDKDTFLDTSDADTNESADNKDLEPWDQLDPEVQSDITTFLTGKNKRNKRCYEFLLSVFELNRDRLSSRDVDAIPTAVIELAKQYESYHNIDHKPGKKPQRERISEYRIKHSKR